MASDPDLALPSPDAAPALGRAALSPRLPVPVSGATFRAFKHPNYRLYYFSQMISLSGTWMQTIAQSWLVLQLTDSKVALGTVTMLQFLPITIFVLFAGVIADRVAKRKFLFATQALAMSQAVALTVLVWSGNVQLWHVYILAAMLGLANAFEQPTRQAFAVELVGREDVGNAIALNSGMFNAARLVGPGIGGFVIAAAGVKVAFMINAISFIPVIAALALMDGSKFHTSERKAEDIANPITELREGLAYVFRTPAAMMIVIMLIFVGTFGFNFMVMLPLITKYMLHRGEISLGLLTGALGLGALISALFMAGRQHATKRMLFTGGAAFGVMITAVAFSSSTYVTLALLFCVGFASTAFQATANTSMQLTAPDRLRGRVMALYMLLFAGSTPIGGYLTGQMAENFGTSWAVGICGSLSTFGIVLGLLYYVTHRAQIPDNAGG